MPILPNAHQQILPCNSRPQSNREVAEMIAEFRTPPGLKPLPLANDIETVLNDRSAFGVPSETIRPT